ncbi:VGLL2 [Cervus elaphus hippelaphus]|uniref:VGLL2 n=1 Tax=Cervus elaphus hippelaphus TaxID=46360 RepID=A0A212C685_CEREH|nr:VGLL2 [Cervus elaphus hippelaphus]
MSCLDVMYQVYGPPQPYFAAAYTPYHQKLAYYSKMQEAQECNASPSNSSGSGSSSFSSQTPASIKEEESSPEKERPPEAEYINSRCVLFTYFQGDISSVVDEHFSRALSQPSSYSPSCSSSKAPRSSGPWRGKRERGCGIPGPLLPCAPNWAEPGTPFSSPWRPQAK